MASNTDGGGTGGGGSNGALSGGSFNKRRRCDHRSGEHHLDMDYYREQQQQQQRALMEDLATMRTRYADLVNEHQQLQQENKRLKELTNAGTDSLFISHTQALSKLEVAQDENARLAQKCDLLERELQSSNAKLMRALKEYNKQKEVHQKLQQQYDEAINFKIKAHKDMSRLTDERNAAMAEYNLIMSERDTVHKEMEKLSDDAAQARKSIKMLDADNKELQADKRQLTYQLESLRREIASALHERDKALKECNELRDAIGAGGELKSRGADAAYDTQSRGGRRLSDTLSQSGDGGSGRKGEQFLRDEHRSEKRLDNLDQANQELEALRKSLDKAQAELAEAVQEAEVSKGRRDWAFSERDKIVLERESIRTLCDNMRKERDRAVSDLAEALRESDAIKKQRNELLKESKALREALESAEQQLSASSPVGGGGGGQVTKWIHTAALPPNCHGLSLTLGVYINRIAEGSGAARDKSLTVGDRVLKINDKNMDDIESTHEAMRALEEAASTAPSDVINITTLKMSYPECPNVFTPIRRYNRACQTDNSDLHLSPSDYKLNSSQEKNSGAWLKEKLDIMRGRRAKDDKKKYRNSSPNPLEFGEAIAELDSVLDSHSHSPSSSSHAPNGVFPNHSSGKTGTIQRKRQSTKEEDKNGGTWPKARAPHVLSISNANATPGGGTVGGRRKERPALSLLNQDYCRNSTPVTLSLAPSATFSPSTLTGRHSVYKSVDATPHFKIADSFERLRIGTVQRLSANTDSMEFNRGMDFYSGKNIPEKNGRDSTLEKGRDFNYLDKGSYVATKDNYGNKNSFSPDRGSYGGKSYTSDKGVFHDKASCFSMDKSIGTPPEKSLSRSKYSDPEHLRSESLLSPEIAHLRGHSHLHMPPARVVFPYQFYPHPHPQLNHSRESFSFEPIAHHQQHIHSPSSILEAGRPAALIYDAIGGGTIPRKREQRFRVPSNPSVTSKVSNGSIERGSSERGSPMPFFEVEVLSSPGDHGAAPQVPPPTKDCCSAHKPVPGELRRVRIDKSNEPLGIQINCPETGGIFVSTVTDNSLASRVGLQIGDQLLEVCGINMRNATYNLAASVLRQCGNSITMLVQYSPDKYNELEGGGGASEGRNSERGGASCSGSTSNEDSEDEDAEEEEEEEEATPCNSPKEVRKQATLQRANQRVPSTVAGVGGGNSGVGGEGEEPRYLIIETLKTSNLGISLVGGNAAGIFIHSVQPDSLAYHAGLRTGDQILEYNGSDLRMATAEEAAYELAKPADKVTVLAHYRIDRYNEIKDKPGDSLYVRCGFDRSGSEHTEPPQLAFNKDDVLYVDNTMFNGVPGQWRAWRLDGEGHRQQCGVIPSKYKVEEELLLRRGGIAASTASDSVEGRAPTRRSFFRKKKRNSTLGVGGTGTSGGGGGGKELASFCNLSPGWYSDSGSLHEDLSLMSYQRVERLQYPEFRPVLVLGPLAECVADKLVSEFPDKFQRASTETRRCSQALLDRELADGLIVEYRRRGTVYECTTVAAVRTVAHNQHHCMLDGGIAVVERLHRHHIYPVVLLIKFKSTKAIREVKDARYSLDKLSGKAAKEMFEHGTKLEEEYRNLMTAVVAAGANVAHMCAQVKAAVDAEHRKSQWVPAASLH